MTEKKVARIERNHTATRKALAREGLRELMGTASGRAFMWEVLSMAGLNQNAFNGNALNTAHHTGRQAIGHELIAQIEEVDPWAYIKMLEENLRANEELKSKLQKELTDDTDDVE